MKREPRRVASEVEHETVAVIEASALRFAREKAASREPG
jgi:hypothetical protein